MHTTILPIILSILASLGFAWLITFANHYINTNPTLGDSNMKLSDFFHALEVVAPVVLAIVPGVPAVLIPAITHGISVAEAMPGASGEAKKAAVIDLVNTTIATTNAAAGKQVIDPTTINAVSNGIDVTVGVVNVIHGKPAAPDADLGVK